MSFNYSKLPVPTRDRLRQALRRYGVKYGYIKRGKSTCAVIEEHHIIQMIDLIKDKTQYDIMQLCKFMKGLIK